MALDAESLLSGPRGRRLCLEFARLSDATPVGLGEFGEAAFYASYDLDPQRGSSGLVMFGEGSESDHPSHSPADVARALGAVELAVTSQDTLMEALSAAVHSARYWQEPGGDDVLAATPEMRSALVRVAEYLCSASQTGWWSSVMAHQQWIVDFADDDLPESADDASTHELLEHWHDAQVEQESRAERDRPKDPSASWSGTWWSRPPLQLPGSTRRLGDGGPIGLRLVEDRLDWRQASIERVQESEQQRVYEIDGSTAWAELCTRYPMQASASRRHDWYRTTGRVGEWVIPDWRAVAQDFDAVHLSVEGYLTTAGIAVALGHDAASVLAGWDPDQTIHLRDVQRDAATRADWARSDDGEEWTTSPGSDQAGAPAAN